MRGLRDHYKNYVEIGVLGGCFVFHPDSPFRTKWLFSAGCQEYLPTMVHSKSHYKYCPQSKRSCFTQVYALPGGKLHPMTDWHGNKSPVPLLQGSTTLKVHASPRDSHGVHWVWQLHRNSASPCPIHLSSAALTGAALKSTLKYHLHGNLF